MKIFSRFDRPEAVPLTCPESSLTQQVYAQQCDLNFLIKQYHLEDNPYELSTLVDPQRSVQFQYLDASQVPDIYSAISNFKQVSQVFALQPYEVQAKYNFSADAFADALLKMSLDDLKKLNLPNMHVVDHPKPEDGSIPASDGQSPEAPKNANNEASA